MALVLEAVLVRQDRQHSLQTLVGEFHYFPASLANEMLVVGMRHHRLVPLESFAKVVSSHQAAFDQKIERAINCGSAHPFPLLLELSPDRLDGEMVVSEKDDSGDEIALPGDGLVMLAEVTAETIEMGRCLSPIEVSHRRGRLQIE
jgi:hypothetical protein